MPTFAGESEIDQLSKIQRVLGPLPPPQRQQLQRNPRFKGVRFPDLGTPVTLHRHFRGDLSVDCIGLVASMLQMDDHHRISCEECLHHIVFKVSTRPPPARLPLRGPPNRAS